MFKHRNFCVNQITYNFQTLLYQLNKLLGAGESYNNISIDTEQLALESHGINFGNIQQTIYNKQDSNCLCSEFFLVSLRNNPGSYNEKSFLKFATGKMEGVLEIMKVAHLGYIYLSLLSTSHSVANECCKYLYICST